MVDIGQQDGLGEGGSYVLARTPVAMSASTDLEACEREGGRWDRETDFVVEGAIYTILLSSKDVCLERNETSQ